MEGILPTDALGLLAVLGLYLLAFLVARWYWIVEPSKQHLLAHLSQLELRIQLAADHVQSSDSAPGGRAAYRNHVIEHLASRRAELTRSIEEAHGLRSRIFRGSRVYLRGWQCYHELERDLVEVRDAREIEGAFAVNQGELAQLSRPPTSSVQAKALLEHVTRVTGRVEEDEALSPELKRNLLKEGLGVVYEARDTFYSTLVDWQEKTCWLVFSALFLILLIGIVFSGYELLVVGAIGGLASKLRGVLNRKQVPTDYGASWATLFLAPPVGALSGWSGVVLVHLAAQGGIFGDWLNMAGTESVKALTQDPRALAVALAFGYSASLFEKAILRAQDSLGGVDAPAGRATADGSVRERPSG